MCGVHLCCAIVYSGWRAFVVYMCGVQLCVVGGVRLWCTCVVCNCV